MKNKAQVWEEMQVRNIFKIKETTKMHRGTCNIWPLFEKELGTNIFAVEAEVANVLVPHRHNHHEFFYILHGRGVMKVEDEEGDVYPGDLIYIPPNALHSIRPKGKEYPIHYLCFGAPISK